MSSCSAISSATERRVGGSATAVVAGYCGVEELSVFIAANGDLGARF